MIDACVAAACRLFSVRNEHGKSVATIGIERIEGTWGVIGFRGFANQPVARALIGLDEHVAQRYEDLWQVVNGSNLAEDRLL